MHRIVRTLCLAMPALAASSGAGGATPPGHGWHPPMPDQEYVLRCEFGRGDAATVVDEPIRLAAPSQPARLDQVVTLPAPWGRVHLVEYLPRARLDQVVKAAEGAQARPAVRVAIEGPTQSFQRWLLADDPARNRLSSFIASWRYMAAAGKSERDELFRQFSTELTRDPVLVVSRPDGRDQVSVPARAGTERRLEKLGCRVRVKQFYPHYGLDDRTKKPVNRSDRRLNPAVLVEIEVAGRKEQRWVFSRFPDFQSAQSGVLPIRLALDCPLARQRTSPEFAILTIGNSHHEIWTRHAGKHTRRTVRLGDAVRIEGSQYRFRLDEFRPAARLVEAYRPTEGNNAVVAIKIEVLSPSDPPRQLWLESGRPHTIATPRGPLMIGFGPRSTGATTRHQ